MAEDFPPAPSVTRKPPVLSFGRWLFHLPCLFTSTPCVGYSCVTVLDAVGKGNSPLILDERAWKPKQQWAQHGAAYAAFLLRWVSIGSWRIGLNSSSWENTLTATELKCVSGVGQHRPEATLWCALIPGLSSCAASLNLCLAKLKWLWLAVSLVVVLCPDTSSQFLRLSSSLLFFLPFSSLWITVMTEGKTLTLVGLQQLGCQGVYKEMKGNGWFSLLIVSVAHGWKPFAILAHPGFIRCKRSDWEQSGFNTHSWICIHELTQG